MNDDDYLENLWTGPYTSDSSPDEFFDGMMYTSASQVIDSVLETESQKEGSQHRSVAALSDLMDSVPTEKDYESGDRVAFIASLQSVLLYPDIPDQGTEGTVVSVKTARGVISTHQEGRVFVTWDDGKFRVIQASHLRRSNNTKVANNNRMLVSNLGDLTGMFTFQASDDSELVHKATKDLWSLKQEGDGFVIERLFDETGNPLKV